MASISISYVQQQAPTRSRKECEFIVELIQKNWPIPMQKHAFTSFLAEYSDCKTWDADMFKPSMAADKQSTIAISKDNFLQRDYEHGYHPWLLSSPNLMHLLPILFAAQTYKINNRGTPLHRPVSAFVRWALGTDASAKWGAADSILASLYQVALEDSIAANASLAGLLESHNDSWVTFTLSSGTLANIAEQTECALQKLAAQNTTGVSAHTDASTADTNPTTDEKVHLADEMNKLYFNFLHDVKSKLTSLDFSILNTNPSFSYLGVALTNLTDVFDKEKNYGETYTLLMKSVNYACKVDLEYSNATTLTRNFLQRMSEYIYENNADTLPHLTDWLTDGGFDPEDPDYSKAPFSQKAVKQRIKYLCEGKPTREDLKDPRNEETTVSKIAGSVGAEIHAQAATNIPCRRPLYSRNAREGVPQFRFGSQTVAINGNVDTNSIFAFYVRDKASEKKAPFVYFNNMRLIDSRELEVTPESMRTAALMRLSERLTTDTFVVITTPANRGLCDKKERGKNGNKRFIQAEDAISELKNLLVCNGLDFHMDENTRAKVLGESEITQQEKAEKLCRKALREVGLEGQKLLTPIERQQLAFHLFKHTLTEEVKEILKPHGYTNPCKDNIDRGGVHTIYNEIVNLLKEAHADIAHVLEVARETDNLDNVENDIKSIEEKLEKNILELLREMHTPAVLVKGRPINENIELLMTAVLGLKRAVDEQIYRIFPKSLEKWLHANQHHASDNIVKPDAEELELLQKTVATARDERLPDDTAPCNETSMGILGIVCSASAGSYSHTASTYKGITFPQMPKCLSDTTEACVLVEIPAAQKPSTQQLLTHYNGRSPSVLGQAACLDPALGLQLTMALQEKLRSLARASREVTVTFDISPEALRSLLSDPIKLTSALQKFHDATTSSLLFTPTLSPKSYRGSLDVVRATETSEPLAVTMPVPVVV